MQVPDARATGAYLGRRNAYTETELTKLRRYVADGLAIRAAARRVCSESGHLFGRALDACVERLRGAERRRRDEPTVDPMLAAQETAIRQRYAAIDSQFEEAQREAEEAAREGDILGLRLDSLESARRLKEDLANEVARLRQVVGQRRGAVDIFVTRNPTVEAALADLRETWGRGEDAARRLAVVERYCTATQLIQEVKRQRSQVPGSDDDDYIPF